MCRVPRVRTPEGKAETVPVPWAGKRSRFTLRYERFAIEVLLACRSVSAAAELLGLSWDPLQAIMERDPLQAIMEGGLERRDLAGLRYVGMDEKSFAKGQSDVSRLNDLEAGRVLEVEAGNPRAAADQLLATLPAPVREALEAVCLDRSGHFAAAAREAVPPAARVHDGFHLSAHLNDGVAAVPREENRRLQKLGDQRRKGPQRLSGFDPDQLEEEQALSRGGAGAEARGTQRQRLEERVGLGDQGRVPAVLVLSR